LTKIVKRQTPLGLRKKFSCCPGTVAMPFCEGKSNPRDQENKMTDTTQPPFQFFTRSGEERVEPSAAEKRAEDVDTVLMLLGRSALLHDAEIREKLQAFLRDAYAAIAGRAQ